METKDKVTLVDFDPAKYLDDAESQAFFLSDALATGNKAYILDALNTVARARGMSDLSRATGMSRQALYAALGPNGNPTLDTLLAVITALGVQLKADVAEARELEPELA